MSAKGEEYVWDSDDEEECVEPSVRKFIHDTKNRLQRFIIPPYILWHYERVVKAKRVITEGTIRYGQVLEDQGYSVDMAIQMEKPVIVRNELGMWMTYQDGYFVSCDKPTYQEGDLYVPPSHFGFGSDHPFSVKHCSAYVKSLYKSADKMHGVQEDLSKLASLTSQ